MIGTVSGKPWIDRAKNGQTKVVFLQVKFALDGDVRTVQYFPGAGVDDVPVKGDIVEVIRDGGILVAVNVKDKADPQREPGEKELYSRDAAGNRLADILLGKEGSAVIASMTSGQFAAAHALKPSGTQYLGNAAAGQDVFTVMNTYLTALVSALTIATSGSPPPTQDPGALAAFTAIRSAAANLQTQWALIFDPAPPVPKPPEGG
jgi:hypothetical protein